MKKSQKVQAEDEPVTLDTFPKTLRDHTAVQHETNNEFQNLCDREEGFEKCGG